MRRSVERGEGVRGRLAIAGRCDGIIRAGPARAAGRGFTLVEVMLATVLLAAGLALAFATLTAASQTATRGEALAERSERMRAVEGFLRRRISAARPVAFHTGQANERPQRFLGEAERMRFVADLPDYLGRGGPYSHDFRIERSGGAHRIVLALDIVSAGETVEDPRGRAPDVLVDGLASARFRYRGIDPENGELGEWTDRWAAVDRLPVLVEASLTDADGGKWPTLVVAIPQALGGATGPAGGGW
ncbi:prepilin-type N-terminal cleavage/methylation domain-containing protein [Lysobacter sp. A03]|uniref:prepilin-type N-terminal cleavage/methylation domain-containing protein n=1 Tax=Lysobacter sp. A03 TaxID=1199154 RepID=UPI000A464A62